VLRVVMIAALIACAMTAVYADEVEVEAAEEQFAEAVEANQEMQTGETEQEMPTGETSRRAPNGFSHKDVKVTAMIPDYLGKDIPAGEDIEMVVWFSNQASYPMKLHGIFAALQSSMDPSRFIQNFTPRGLNNVIVDSGTEASVSYKFHPSEYLTPMPYRFFSIIEYTDEKDQHYYNVLFNETLPFSEANVAFDFELIMTYLILIGIVVGSGYLIYNCIANKASKSKSKNAAKSEPVPHDQNEWLVGTSAHKSSKKEKAKAN